MQQMYHPSDLASMDPLVLMKNLDHVRMTSRRLSYILQQQVHLRTPPQLGRGLRGRAEGDHEPRRVPRGAAGEPVAFEQHDVAAAGVREMVGHRGADDPATHDDHAGPVGQAVRPGAAAGHAPAV